MDLIQIGQPRCDGDEARGGTHIDPVCGMTVDPATAAGSFRYEGKDYFFCSRHCLEKFRASPEAYVAGTGGGTGRLTPPARREFQARREIPGATYTCPMHPEIVQEGPGACPKCGMALEPVMPTAEEGPDPEL